MPTLNDFAEQAYIRYSRTLGLTHIIPFHQLPVRAQQAWRESIACYHSIGEN